MDKEIQQRYERIIIETNAELIASRLEIKQVEKRMGEIMIKAQRNMKELSLLL